MYVYIRYTYIYMCVRDMYIYMYIYIPWRIACYIIYHISHVTCHISHISYTVYNTSYIIYHMSHSIQQLFMSFLWYAYNFVIGLCLHQLHPRNHEMESNMSHMFFTETHVGLVSRWEKLPNLRPRRIIQIENDVFNRPGSLMETPLAHLLGSRSPRWCRRM